MPKTLIWPAGGVDDAVSQYRLLLPTQALRAQGASVEVDPVGPTIMWNREWHSPVPPPDARAIALAKVPDCETIVMQRPAMRWWADVIPMLQAHGIRIVVDVDDDFNAIPKGSAAYDSHDPKHGWHNREWIAYACELADLVTASTPALVKIYGHGHGMLVPNLVPERYLKITPHFKREKTAGWTGKMNSHTHDLESTRGKVGEALRDAGWAFHVLGLKDGVKDALGLAEEPTEHFWVPFAEYPLRMAEPELGIVPLDDSRFNRAKSALKMMEFAALGVPVVASGTPDNTRMGDAGIGMVVKRPHQWGRTMKTVLRSAELRAEMAGRGREIMADYTYEKKAWMWAFAWRLDGERIRNLHAAAS